MLAPSNDFGYAQAPHHHAMAGYDQQHHSGERPKIFMDGGHMHNGMHHPGMAEFQHMVGNPHAMTPQHHHQGGDFDHEPLMMNMHNPQSHFYPAMGGQMLHVSADYASSMDGTTPSARGNSSGSKRSREELNLKEKKRMFKLNDRITHLKAVLDEAGVQSKKNKQSILDNTYHYIGMLRSNLLIAKQKAERAEKQAEAYRNQKGGAASEADQVFKRCFQQSATPRLLVDLELEPVTYNSAFLHHTGLTEDVLSGSSAAVRGALCIDNNKLDSILHNAKQGKAMTAVVQARGAMGVSSVTLMVSALMDDAGAVSHLEFSLFPMDVSGSEHQTPPQSFHSALKAEIQDASPSSMGELAL